MTRPIPEQDEAECLAGRLAAPGLFAGRTRRSQRRGVHHLCPTHDRIRPAIRLPSGSARLPARRSQRGRPCAWFDAFRRQADRSAEAGAFYTRSGSRSCRSDARAQVTPRRPARPTFLWSAQRPAGPRPLAVRFTGPGTADRSVANGVCHSKSRITPQPPRNRGSFPPPAFGGLCRSREGRRSKPSPRSFAVSDARSGQLDPPAPEASAKKPS